MNRPVPAQLPLGIRLRDEASFDSFHGQATAPLVELLRGFSQLDQPPADSCIYLWGASGSGRSHLLQAACQQMSAAGGSSIYLPLKQLLEHPAELLEGMEGLDLLCIDDLQVLAGRNDWQEALFHLYNRLRDAGQRLLLAADCAPRQLPLELPDLVSRLGWGLVFQLPTPDDADKQAILQLRAAQRGLQLPDEVARYLLTRGGRGLDELFNLLERLDQASLQAQRRLTLPFVKQVLGW